MMTAGLLGAEATTGGSLTRRAMEEAHSEEEGEAEGALRPMEARQEGLITPGWTKKEMSWWVGMLIRDPPEDSE